ncbi:MAG: hypothetical protein IPJ88_06140 [Myxococcales bacterium]|nr:MAG: hypothetical protein IPJ88_06140 [Myxococcales bacterium]
MLWALIDLGRHKKLSESFRASLVLLLNIFRPKAKRQPLPSSQLTVLRMGPAVFMATVTCIGLFHWHRSVENSQLASPPGRTTKELRPEGKIVTFNGQSFEVLRGTVQGELEESIAYFSKLCESRSDAAYSMRSMVHHFHRDDLAIVLCGKDSLTNPTRADVPLLYSMTSLNRSDSRLSYIRYQLVATKTSTARKQKTSSTLWLTKALPAKLLFDVEEVEQKRHLLLFAGSSDDVQLSNKLIQERLSERHWSIHEYSPDERSAGFHGAVAHREDATLWIGLDALEHPTVLTLLGEF